MGDARGASVPHAGRFPQEHGGPGPHAPDRPLGPGGARGPHTPDHPLDRDRSRALRVTAIASLIPLEELEADPFLVDSRSQHAICARWAAERGYVVTRELLVGGLRTDHRTLWEDVEAGLVDLFVAPSRRVLERALVSVDEFTAECVRRGVRVETVGCVEPSYDAQMKARIHRRLSMPTAGYDGR